MNSRRFLTSLYVLLIAGLGVGGGALFLDARAEYTQLKQAQAASRQKLAEKEKELREREKILDRLRHDPAYVEKIIRLQLGYTKPGDFIWRYED